MHLLLLERGVVLAQLVLAVVERLDDGVEVRLRRSRTCGSSRGSCRRTGSCRAASWCRSPASGSRSSIVRRRSSSVAATLAPSLSGALLHRPDRGRQEPVRRLGARRGCRRRPSTRRRRPWPRTPASGRRGRRSRRRTRRPWRRAPAPPPASIGTIPSAVRGATAATGPVGVRVSSAVPPPAESGSQGSRSCVCSCFPGGSSHRVSPPVRPACSSRTVLPERRHE